MTDRHVPAAPTEAASLPELLEAYAHAPGPTTLHPLQDAILRAPNHDPLSALGPDLSPLEQAGDHQGIVDEIWRRMPGLLLSPTAHLRLSGAYESLGEHEAAHREHALARLAMGSLQDSGTGEESAPYRVLRIEDEYDLLGAAGLRSREQRERADARGTFDVHTTDDGASWWFELLWRRSPAA